MNDSNGSRVAVLIDYENVFIGFRKKISKDESVRPSKALARFVIAVLDKGIIDSILHGIAYVFTVTGDFIKVMNAWLIDGVGDGIPKGIFAFGGFMRRTQSGRIQVYLLIVLAAVLILGIIFAISAGAVLAS